MGKIHCVTVFDITPDDVEVKKYNTDYWLTIGNIEFHFDQAEDMLAMLDTARTNLLDMTTPIEA